MAGSGIVLKTTTKKTCVLCGHILRLKTGSSGARPDLKGVVVPDPRGNDRESSVDF